MRKIAFLGTFNSMCCTAIMCSSRKLLTENECNTANIATTTSFNMFSKIDSSRMLCRYSRILGDRCDSVIMIELY